MHHDQSMMNGDHAQSRTISHLASYPVVSDSIEFFKKNQLGSKSIELADGAYHRFAKPFEPLVQGPYAYVKPYVNKVDEIGDKALGQIDNRFPLVKEDTEKVNDKIISTIFFPLRLANGTKDYLFNTYHDEYRKTAQHDNRGEGLTTLIMAIISTELKIASDFFQAVADFLGPKYEGAKEKGSNLIENAQRSKDNYMNQAKQTKDHYLGQAQQKAQNAYEEGVRTKDHLQNDAQKKVGETKDQVQNESQKKMSEMKDQHQHETHKKH